MSREYVIRTILLTAFALIAFAFNSILCRMALRGGEADAIGFTFIRLVAGAVTLITISYFFGKGTKTSERGNWISAFFLFAYAVCFSLAYLALSAGTGALILFGSVQLTMILIALFRGERPGVVEWLGLGTALGGLVYLVFPGLASPPLHSSLLMAAAGAAWGIYTLRGKDGGDPLAQTTGNFLWSVPMIAVASIPFFSQIHLSGRGIVIAIVSGGIASGLGYTVWYAALNFHTSTRAAVLQLAVPLIAAAGGVLLLSETATTRLWIAAALILGGIGLTIFGRK
jgi:drug/metabolite transporter (DMT)-like permease